MNRQASKRNKQASNRQAVEQACEEKQKGDEKLEEEKPSKQRETSTRRETAVRRERTPLNRPRGTKAGSDVLVRQPHLLGDANGGAGVAGQRANHAGPANVGEGLSLREECQCSLFFFPHHHNNNNNDDDDDNSSSSSSSSSSSPHKQGEE